MNATVEIAGDHEAAHYIVRSPAGTLVLTEWHGQGLVEALVWHRETDTRWKAQHRDGAGQVLIDMARALPTYSPDACRHCGAAGHTADEVPR